MPLSVVATWLAGRPARPLAPLQITPDSQEIDRNLPHLITARNGQYCKLVLPAACPPRVRGNRKPITHFSYRSRRAFQTWMNCIDRGKVNADEVLFVTLTYPRNFPAARASKADLERFIKRHERAWGHMAIAWRLEAQRRGAPHFHLMVFTQGGVVAFEQYRRWVAQAWHELAGDADRWHIVHGVKVEQMQSWNGCSYYLAKYMAKPDPSAGGDAWHEPGRLWGIRRRDLLPVELERVNVSKPEAHQIRRFITRYYDHLPSGRFKLHWPVTGRVEKRWLTPDLVKLLRESNPGMVIQPIKRKWKRHTGGASAFIKYDDLIRYIETCWTPREKDK